MFEHFNRALFEGALPPAMLVFASHKNALGYFVAGKWRKQDEQNGASIGEIALNPEHLGFDERDVASTIVHEMAHLWQHVFGTPSRRGYHNAEWATQMEELGLMPSSTAQAGGKRTGQRMTHFILDDRPFAQAFLRFAKSALLPFVAAEEAAGGPKKADRSKTKYSCGTCGLNAWARRDADLHHCGRTMESA